MAGVRVEIHLVVDFVLGENFFGLISQILREDGVCFGTRDDQRFGNLVQFLIRDKGGVGKCADVEDAGSREMVGQVFGTEAVTNAGQKLEGVAGFEGVEERHDDGGRLFWRMLGFPIWEGIELAGEWVTAQNVDQNHGIIQLFGKGVGNQSGVHQLDAEDVREDQQVLTGILFIVFCHVTVDATDLLDVALGGAGMQRDRGTATCLWGV